MTSTNGSQPALSGASPLSNAEWCDYSGNYHHDTDDDADDFGPARKHVVEFDHVVASTGEPAPGTHEQPYALVCVMVPEKRYYDHGEDDDPTVALSGRGYPHFTPAEARQLAATLTAAADRAEEIAAERAFRSVAAA